MGVRQWTIYFDFHKDFEARCKSTIDWTTVTSGVTNELVLSLFVSIEYLNDENVYRILNFADLKLYINVTLCANIKLLQEDLCHLSDWSLNQKCHIIRPGAWSCTLIREVTKADYFLQGNIFMDTALELDLGMFIAKVLKCLKIVLRWKRKWRISWNIFSSSVITRTKKMFLIDTTNWSVGTRLKLPNFGVIPVARFYNSVESD